MNATKKLFRSIPYSLFTLVLSLCLLVSLPAHAGQVTVVDVKITALSGDQYRIDTTLSHQDTGWDHYANAWLVYDEADRLLGERVLHHPHVNEQPFTRSLTLSIPEGVKKVIIRGQDSVHGINPQGMTVAVPQ